MTISGGRTKQFDIFCRITGFTSDFLSFLVAELIWFFHGALQLQPHGSHYLFYCYLNSRTFKDNDVTFQGLIVDGSFYHGTIFDYI